MFHDIIRFIRNALGSRRVNNEALVQVARFEVLADKELPSPCCGYLTLEQPPGSYDICPICR